MTISKETGPEIISVALPQLEDEVIMSKPSLWANLWKLIKFNLLEQPLHN